MTYFHKPLRRDGHAVKTIFFDGMPRWRPSGGLVTKGHAQSQPRKDDDTMIRVHVTEAAYHAITATVDGALMEPQRSPQGGIYLWLDDPTRRVLDRARRPGESYSETILRLAELERATP